MAGITVIPRYCNFYMQSAFRSGPWSFLCTPDKVYGHLKNSIIRGRAGITWATQVCSILLQILLGVFPHHRDAVLLYGACVCVDQQGVEGLWISSMHIRFRRKEWQRQLVDTALLALHA